MSLPTPTEWGDTGIDWDNPGIYIPFAIVEIQQALDERYTAINVTPHAIVTYDFNGAIITRANKFPIAEDLLGGFRDALISLAPNFGDQITGLDGDTSIPTWTYTSLLTHLSASDPLPAAGYQIVMTYTMFKTLHDMINLLIYAREPDGSSVSLVSGEEISVSNATYAGAVTDYNAASPTSTSSRTHSDSIFFAAGAGSNLLNRVRQKTEITGLVTDFESSLPLKTNAILR